ncbi:ankyrin repeat domain-containing protein [Mycena latifolia]|nr:ankyrin repeat domain-containing protein [Mycena latifolia]
MAEALGTLASILQLVDTILKAREYIKDFHEAPKEQKKLFSEMEGLKALLMELDKRVTGSPASVAFQQMVEPLATFKTTLELVTKKLGPVDGLSKFTRRLSWTLWSKKEVAGYLEDVERIKGLINLWMTMDIWDVGQQQISNQDSILNTVQVQKDTIDAEKRQKILDWMSPLNFLQRQADVYGTLQPGTGEWLLREAQFQDWESHSGKVLLCRGIPGAGKTVLASLVVHHLEIHARTIDIGLACIYLNHKETETQTITNLLGGLWRQLMLGKPISTTVQNLYDYHHERQTRPQLEEICKALDSAVAQYTKVFIVIDALDEYPDHHRHLFLKYLVNLLPQTCILMTSRPHINLDAQFPNMKTIEIRATEEDIHKYLDAQIQNSARLSKHVRTRPEFQDEIRSKILGNVKGMFLLAKLHIESLATKNTIKAVREALQHLPKDLQHTYDEALERINHQTEEDRHLGMLALTWVANAKRPLSVAELREALAIEPDSTFLDVDNLLDMDIILSACAGLIIVEEAVSVVRLIHYTTQDYLDSIQSEQFPLAHITIVSTCLTYLSFPEFEVLPRQWEDEEQEDLFVAHPFLKYAQYCLMHAKGEPELFLQDKLMAFFAGASRFTRVWDDTVPWKGIYSDYHLPPLSISAACGLEVTMRQLLAQGIAPEDMDAALCAASSTGHIHLVQLLIDAGAKINSQDDYYGHPLAAASWNGHDSVVQLLIENGVDLNGQGTRFGNALQTASIHGHESVAQLLIMKGADVNAQGGIYGNALQAALEHGHESVVQLLIEKGADVNAQGGHFGNALQAASMDGHKSVVQLLIEKGADVNAQGGYYGNALQAALECGHKLVVQLLIEKGADVNAQRGTYGNALQAASMRGYESVVQLFIKKGANVNAQGGYYGNALQAASWYGHKSVVRLLIEKGADVSAQGGHYRNALQAAAWNGHESVVQLLIEKGADVNAQGGLYGNALQAAARNGHESVVELLIKKGADVDAQGGLYGNALQAASMEGHELVVQLLIKKGADVNAQGGLYGNAFQAASGNGHKLVAQLLIGHGADASVL